MVFHYSPSHSGLRSSPAHREGFHSLLKVKREHSQIGANEIMEEIIGVSGDRSTSYRNDSISSQENQNAPDGFVCSQACVCVCDRVNAAAFVSPETL